MKNCKKPGSIKITSEPEISEDADSGTVETVVVEQPTEGQAVYQHACSVCHAAGVGEAPIPGDSAAWSARLALGRDALIESALNGKGIMPAKGGQSQLSDAAVTSAVDYIISLSAKQ